MCCVLSGHARFEYARTALQLSAPDYLLKPLHREELEHLLRKFSIRASDAGRENAAGRYSPLVEETVRYMQAHLADEISRESITQQVHVSECHISRLFRKETGCSITEFITNMRISRAQELLTDTNCSITDICAQIGYNYQAYFSKVFRDRTGMTPNRYRASFRKEMK